MNALINNVKKNINLVVLSRIMKDSNIKSKKNDYYK
jgi:hypothetical protein